MESQAEYLILNCNKHIKPPFDNKCDSVIHVENFEQFTTVLEDSGDMDFVYLCHIINDNYDNIKPLSKQLFDIIKCNQILNLLSRGEAPRSPYGRGSLAD